MRPVFAISSVVFLVVLAISPFKDFFRAWRGHQNAYNELTGGLPQRIKPVEIGIKQLWIQKLDRVDRCTTCHLGLDRDELARAREPFRKHPEIYHSVEDYGCTVCHEGQGLATTAIEAHGMVKYWEKRVLPPAYMEAACGKCHKEEKVPSADILTLGRKLIREARCVGCHRIDGFEKEWAPSLDGIGSKVNRDWLVRWLKDPSSYSPKTRMPNFLLTDEEADDLADYLMTLQTFPNRARLEPLPGIIEGSQGQKEKLIELGKTRFREARCISCHPINDRGGYVATDLGKVASKVSTPWLYNYLENPKRLQPGVQMPRYRFSESELAAVVMYMQDEFVDYEAEKLPAHPRDPAFYEKGIALVKKFNCTGCHELGDVKKGEQMGPDLSVIGSKNLYEIDFGKSTIEETLPSYLFTKLKTPRVFLSGMKMPSYQFTEDEAIAVTVALLANTNEAIPPELTIPAAAPSAYEPQGDFGRLVNDLACFGCHTMFGRGRLVATDLSLEASQAQKGWIKNYFKLPYSLRPILTERMPNFFLSDREINTLVDYMETVFMADSLETPELDAKDIETGEALFFNKYGCQSCHQVNQKGGYVGPALDHVGSRLKSGWVYSWIQNPRALNPNTIEPGNNPTAQEAESLTAYLMSLK